MKNTLKPGTLIRFNPNAKGIEGFWEGGFPRFCPVVNGKIRNDLYWEDWIPAESNAFLMFVESLDYSKKTAATAAVTPAATAAAATAAAAWEKVKEEFKTTGRILGGVFLTPGGQLIWVSHYHLECFEEVSSK